MNQIDPNANPYEHTFFDAAALTELWQMVVGLLSLASPAVLIFVAIVAVGMLVTIAIVAFKKAANDDDDEDYDIKYYD